MPSGLPWSHPDADPLADMQEIAKTPVLRQPQPVWSGPNQQVTDDFTISVWPQTLWLCSVLYNQQWMMTVWNSPESDQATVAG